MNKSHLLIRVFELVNPNNMKIDIDTLNICRSIVIGCHDYNGGYHDEEENKIYHHGIQTVANVFEALIEKGIDDYQIWSLYVIGESKKSKQP